MGVKDFIKSAMNLDEKAQVNDNPDVNAYELGEGEAAVPGNETAEATAPPAPTPAEIEALKAEAAKAKEYWDRLLRATADYDNFKKRTARERQEAVKFANEGLVEKLLPVLDAFDMAMAASNNAAEQSMQSLQAGVNMIQQQLKRVLTEAGLEEIDASNQVFDPNLHEAVSQMESAEVEEGRVLQQLRKGYKLHERLVRPASVVVAKAPVS